MNRNNGCGSTVAFWLFAVLIAVVLIAVFRSAGTKGAVVLTPTIKRAGSSYSYSGGSYGKTTAKPSSSTNASSTKKSAGSIGGKSSSKSSGKKNDDPYDAKNYEHPDDFYYDHYDDFFDYEEAEEYWNEHN